MPTSDVLFCELDGFWRQVDARTKIPRNAVWGMVFFALLLG